MLDMSGKYKECDSFMKNTILCRATHLTAALLSHPQNQLLILEVVRTGSKNCPQAVAWHIALKPF